MTQIDKIIAKSLKQNFSNSKIYTERAEQIQPPSFLINTVKDSFDKKLGNLYKNEVFYQIVYIENEDKQYITDYEKLKEIGFKLYDIFEVIQTDIILKGYDMSYRIEDNTLQFFVTFKIRYYRQKEQILMQNLKLNEKNKGD